MSEPSSAETFQHWGHCDQCGFQGLMVFRSRRDEDYSDEEALGFMMDSSCPACGHEEAVLVVVEEYQDMVRLRKPPRVGG
jgi:hypothetical protein